MNVDRLQLKAHLLVDGINPASDAFLGLGTEFKEQNHGLFGWDFVNHKNLHLPDDFVLSDGTVVQFRYNPSSSFSAELRDGERVIVKEGEVLDSLSFISRPRFYDALTKQGNIMRQIAQVGGEDCFFVCYQNYCAHFARGEECLFCNLVPTKQTYNSVLSKKGIGDIGEVAAAAFAEGMCNHILLTGGCFNQETEVSVVSGIVEVIREALGADTVPGTILPSATTEEDDLRRYRETGIGAIGYSMEIWDETLYKGICPGKARTTSHDDFVAAIQRAVRIFGEGNVYAVFVMGLEPRSSLLAGIEALTSIGANVVPFVWSPNPGSKLDGHRAPTGRWFTEVVLESAEIVLANGVPSGTANHCYRCDGNSLLHDALRLSGVE
ncbi:MAG: radical SAM protein [Candidatus Aquicultorales bacterium]